MEKIPTFVICIVYSMVIDKLVTRTKPYHIPCCLQKDAIRVENEINV